MPLKDQLKKIKENWLMILLVLIVLVFLNVGSLPLRSAGIASKQMAFAEESSYSGGYGIQSQRYPSPIYEDFAPDAAERKITKSSSMSLEVETGGFQNAESKLKSILKLSGSYLLNENLNRHGSGWKSYYSGSYQIKVDSRKYSDIVAQLKGIGEVKSFVENADDITGSYKNLGIEINAEKQRLDRYKKMFEEATIISDKIQLSDKIFDQERKIKYMEDSIKNIEQRVDYSAIYITLNEKQPKYANIVFVKFSELVRRLVMSINSLLTLIFVSLPYAVAALIIWIIARFFRKRM